MRTRTVYSRYGLGLNWKVLSADAAVVSSGFARSRASAELAVAAAKRTYVKEQKVLQGKFMEKYQANPTSYAWKKKPFNNYTYGSATKQT